MCCALHINSSWIDVAPLLQLNCFLCPHSERFSSLPHPPRETSFGWPGLRPTCRFAASEAVRWTTERAVLLTDHNNRVSHGPNPLWLLSLTPPHPSPISSAHVGAQTRAGGADFLVPFSAGAPLTFPFHPSPPDYVSRPTSCTI